MVLILQFPNWIDELKTDNISNMNPEDLAPEKNVVTNEDAPKTESPVVLDATGASHEQKAETSEIVVEKVDTIETLEAVDLSTIIEDPEAYLARIDSSTLSENDKRYLIRDMVGKIYSTISDADSKVHMERLKLRYANEALGLDVRNWREAESQEINDIKQKKSLASIAVTVLKGYKKQTPQVKPKTEESDISLGNSNREEMLKEQAEQEKFSSLRNACSRLVEPLGGLSRIIRIRRGDNLPTFLGESSSSLLSSVMERLNGPGSIDTQAGRDKFVLNIQEAVRELLGAFSGEEYFRERGIKDDLESLSFFNRKLREVDESIRNFAGSVHKLEINELEEVAPLLSGLLARIDNVGSLVSRRRSAIERYLDRRY